MDTSTYLRDETKTDILDDESSQEAAERQRLFKAIERSHRKLRPYRHAVMQMNKEYAGPFYGLESNTEFKAQKYVNFLKQAVKAYMTVLASRRPNVLVTTPSIELKPFAEHYQHALNKLLEQIDIEDTMRTWVRDAFFWLGITKVHMADTGEMVDGGDILIDPGQPFVSNIALDDFYFDTNAKKWSECRYMGDSYRLPVDYVLNSGLYKGEALRDLHPTPKHATSHERLADVSMGNETDDEELEPMCDIMDVWLPRKKEIHTYVIATKVNAQLKGPPIAKMAWKGKKLGPYHLLHFDEVSENCMPSSVAADLYPLDRLISNLYTKQAKKAKRTKRNPAYTPAGSDSARKIKNASDGDWVEVQDAREINVIESGGVDPAIQGFLLNSMDAFDRQAGNLQAMMGLGAQTDTVGQEQLVHGAQNRSEGELQNCFIKPANRLMNDLAFLLWEDSHMTIENSVDIEGVPGASYDTTWTPDDREGEFENYNFEIDVYSLQHQSPADRITKINGLLQQFYLPLMPYIQQQGGTIDLAKLVELHSDLLDLPRLKEIAIFNAPPVEGGSEQNPMKSPVSNRTYTRRNEGGNSGGGMGAEQWLKQANTPKS